MYSKPDELRIYVKSINNYIFKIEQDFLNMGWVHLGMESHEKMRLMEHSFDRIMHAIKEEIRCEILR